MRALWQDWVNVVLGIWVAIQPWVLGFSNSATATWSSLAAGVLVIIFTLWAANQHAPMQHGTSAKI